MIQLGEPWALLFLLALPVILVLHVLRPRRRTVSVPGTWLWREALRERQRGLGLQKLLRNLSLLLLLLFALIAALVLSAPEWLTRVADEGDTVLVLDVSASMQARDGDVSRFDRARALAQDLIDTMPGNARMLIMTSGRRAQLRSGFERDRRALARVLDGLRAGDESGRPREALDLALSLLRHSERGRVRFITDGAFGLAADPGSPRVEVVRVGAAARNVAITRFDFRPEVGRDDRFQVLLALRNYTAEAVTVPVSIRLEGRQLLQRDQVLPAGGSETVVLPFRGRAIGRAVARIDVSDDLDADNAAFAVVNVPEPRRVLLVTPGNFYLSSVLDALPGVETTVAPVPSAQELSRLARRHDIVVFDRVAAPALAPGNYLLLDTVPPGLPFVESGSVASPAIVGQGPSALLRDVDLSGVRIDAARRVSVNDAVPGLQHLFWSTDTPLALALIDERMRLVYLGFDLARSDLPLKAAFPLLISQSLDWLRPRTGVSGVTSIAAGEPQLIRAPVTRSDLIMRTPSGDAYSYRLDNGELRYEATSHAGLYRYSIDGVVRHFAVNLTDAAESEINASATPVASAASVPPAPTDAQAARALWPLLTALALAVLLLEWGLWCTRRGSA